MACGSRVAHIRCSTVADGDFHIDVHPRVLEHRRQSFTPGAWTQLDEVHGNRVVVVGRPGEHDLAEGDGAITRQAGVVLAVWVGDCAPVVLVGDGVVGVAHAGWKGALAGVLDATARAMGPGPVRAVLGPCIHPCCYEFGEADLVAMRDRFGASVVATTRRGTPALSMPAVVRSALGSVGVELTDVSLCTRHHPQWYFSHRRGELQRQVVTVRMMEQ